MLEKRATGGNRLAQTRISRLLQSPCRWCCCRDLNKLIAGLDGARRAFVPWSLLSSSHVYTCCVSESIPPAIRCECQPSGRISERRTLRKARIMFSPHPFSLEHRIYRFYIHTQSVRSVEKAHSVDALVGRSTHILLIAQR